MSVRAATEADIDGIVEVMLKATPFDPQHNYRFPDHAQYPEEHFVNTRLWVEYLVKPQYVDYVTVVTEGPDLEDPTKSRIAAVAIWDITYINIRKHGKDYKAPSPAADSASDARRVERRSTNPAHMTAFRTGMMGALDRFFNDVYGTADQMFLIFLNTHPDYWRKGHGAALVKWGIDMAESDERREKMVVTLLASPMGAKLYSRLGFRLVGTQVIQAEGEEETLLYDAMVYDVGGDKSG